MKYFIIIDAQEDFTRGALKNDTATAKIPAIVEKAKELKAQGYRIIATQDTHFEDYLKTQEGINLPVPHCIKGTKGWEVVDEIKPFVDRYLEKLSFGYPNWKDFMEDDRIGNEKPEEIVMAGYCTGICVASNFSVLKATYPETPIKVLKDLCACVSPESHEAALATMKVQQAIIE